MVPQAQPLAFRHLDTGPTQRLHELIVAQDVEALFEGFEIVWAYQHEGGPPVSGHEDPIVLKLHGVGEFGKMRLDFREGHRVAHRSDL